MKLGTQDRIRARACPLVWLCSHGVGCLHVKLLFVVITLVNNEFNYIYTGVCEKNTPPDKISPRSASFQSPKSCAGEQFLLLDCRAKASTKGVLYIYIYIYLLICLSMCLFVYVYVYIDLCICSLYMYIYI